jgi:hypothetical protein
MTERRPRQLRALHMRQPALPVVGAAASVGAVVEDVVLPAEAVRGAALRLMRMAASEQAVLVEVLPVRAAQVEVLVEVVAEAVAHSEWLVRPTRFRMTVPSMGSPCTTGSTESSQSRSCPLAHRQPI